MSRAEYRKAAEDATHEARAAARKTFVTGFPLLIGLAGLSNQLWPAAIRRIFGYRRDYEQYVLVSLTACIIWFAGVLGFRSLCRRHWGFAFFCLGPMASVAGVALFFGLQKGVMMKQDYADPWLLAAGIPSLILLGLMIDLKHLAHVPRSLPGRSTARGIAGASIILVMFCTFLSFGTLEFAIGCAAVPATLIAAYAAKLKIRAAPRCTGETEAIRPAAEESSQP